MKPFNELEVIVENTLAKDGVPHRACKNAMEKRQKSSFQSWLKKDALAAGRAWFENDIENKGKIAKDETITLFDLCMKYKATFLLNACQQLFTLKIRIQKAFANDTR